MKWVVIIAFCAGSVTLQAQHDHHMEMQKDTSMHHDHMKMGQDSTMHHMNMDTMSMQMMPMNNSYSLNLPMNRDGSGTAWLPDESPMYGYMIHAKKWMLMVHGNIFIRYNKQDVTDKGLRGNEKWDAPNWLMLMAQRKVGRKGLFHFSIMPSFDYTVAGGSGYPLLFQTGESFKGEPLVDRQHPHDLFSELSVSYSHSFNENTDAFIYVGYPGEPAIGSVAFMHRPSSLPNPDAPITHHWNDGTHITFGVATIGFRYKKFKIEASSFTGREPDENRYNFDSPKFDSQSLRLSYSPSKNWTLQVSQAYVVSPEELNPDENVNRTTASFIYSKKLADEKSLNITGLWGLNNMMQMNENAFLLEGAINIKRFTPYFRYEHVQKSTEELNLNANSYGEMSLFGINELTAGVGFDLIHSRFFNLSLGAQGTYFNADKRLNSLYGENPMAAEVYIRLYPPMMKMHKM